MYYYSTVISSYTSSSPRRLVADLLLSCALVPSFSSVRVITPNQTPHKRFDCIQAAWKLTPAPTIWFALPLDAIAKVLKIFTMYTESSNSKAHREPDFLLDHCATPSQVELEAVELTAAGGQATYNNPHDCHMFHITLHNYHLGSFLTTSKGRPTFFSLLSRPVWCLPLACHIETSGFALI